MKNTSPIQYTLRGVPKRIDEALREKAKQEGVSLNQAAIEALGKSLGLTEDRPVYRDLDDLIGTWVDDPAFDDAIKAMDTVDEDAWR